MRLRGLVVPAAHNRRPRMTSNDLSERLERLTRAVRRIANTLDGQGWTDDDFIGGIDALLSPVLPLSAPVVGANPGLGDGHDPTGTATAYVNDGIAQHAWHDSGGGIGSPPPPRAAGGATPGLCAAPPPTPKKHNDT